MQIALVPYQVSVSSSDLTQVAAALQIQVSDHFAPLWGIDAHVAAFTDWSAVPADYTRLILVDHVDSGLLGVHNVGTSGPFALIAVNGDWPIVASHECLELLADPTGRATRSGVSPRDGTDVDFLLEVCDPCQGASSAYPIHGIPVSDFAAPAFYSGGGGGSPYSYAGNLVAPQQIAKNGYIVWHDPVADEWWRRDYFGAAPTDYSLGSVPPEVSCLRGHIDRVVRTERRTKTSARRFEAKPTATTRARANAIAAHLRTILPSKKRKGAK